MGTQVSTVVIQLSVVSWLCPNYSATSVVFCVRLWSQLLDPCGLSWFSARGVRQWYRICTISVQSTCYAGSYNNNNFIWYV